MEYENVLLIGGPKDGERIQVLSGVPAVRVGFLPEGMIGLRDARAPVDYKEVIYHRHSMQTSHGLNTAVYVYGEIDALAALINGYRPGG